MSLTPAPEQTMEGRRQLAASVVDALTSAGLEVHLADPTTAPIPGAEVEIDQFDDAEGGVFVTWRVSDALVSAFEVPLLAHDFDHPTIRLHGDITRAMSRALQAVLEASGYRVAISAGEYRPDTLRVLAR